MSTTNADREAQWRAGFEEAGREAISNFIYRGHDSFGEPKRQYAFRWLREQEKAVLSRDAQLRCYVQWTFWAAVAAVIVGVVGVAVTWVR